MSGIEHTPATGRIVTFYSYKGGTGRTMALANVAWLLASNGFRVLTIDWDLESPGLHRYFHPFLKDKDQRYSEGVLDLARKYSAATLLPAYNDRQLRDATSILEYAASLEWDFPQGGRIDFIGPGRQDDGYAMAVSTFDWDAFWNRMNGGRVIDELGAQVRAHYDFVLIDSRTGTSDTAGICTIQLPDTVVNCFTLNTQSVTGAEAVTNSILQTCTRPITVYPVPTRIENAEQEKLDRRRRYARALFRPYLNATSEEDSEAYWDAVEVPYIPYFAYEEVLAPFGGQRDLVDSYEGIASRIAGRPCPAPRLTESERRRVLRAFEQAEVEPIRMLVAYAPLDRIWAEWLRDRYQSPQVAVTLHCVRDDVPDLVDFDRLLLAVSRDLSAHPTGRRLLRVAEERGQQGEGTFAAAIRMDATPVTTLPATAVIDVRDTGEEHAIELLSAGLFLGQAGTLAERRHESTIRYPTVATPHWNVKLGRNARFAGRGAVMEEIRDRLQSAGPDGGRLVLSGLPGVGKTLAALEYVYRFAPSYDVVWWISVTEPSQARIGLAELAKDLGVGAGNDVDVLVTSVLTALRQGDPTARWLVVFDNADSPEDIETLLPAGSGDLLITSRNPQWSSLLPNLDINVFQPDESVELLTRRVPGIPVADAARLAARLGDLPLALEQAGGWISSTGMTVADYLELFGQDAAEAMNEGAPVDYRRTITATVRVAYDELRRRSPAAALLLELYACMAPDTIPFRLISNEKLSELLIPFDQMMRDKMRHAGLNREIAQYGLARISSAKDGGGVVLHRLTQDIIRSLLREEDQLERLRQVQAVLVAAARGNPENPANWTNYEALRPHLQPAGVLTAEASEVRHLVLDMVRYLWRRGDAASSIELAETALKEWEHAFGLDDIWTLRLRYELGVALRNEGREDDAFALNRDNYERLCQKFGEGDLYTLMAAMSQAADLRARGDYFDARDLDEKTAPRLRDLLGDEERLALNAVSNLAVSARLVGDYERAARLDRETLDRRRRVLGKDDPDTLNSAFNYGVDLLLSGDLSAAGKNLAARYVDRQMLGSRHLRAFWIGKSYASALRLAGDVAGAAGVIEGVTPRAHELFGRLHPVTLACRLEAACVLWAEGKHDAARQLAEEVYTDYRTRHGKRHPDALAAGSNLSILRRLTGDLDGALRLAELTADRFETALGPQHPYALAAQITLANALHAAGERGAARNRDEDVYGRLRKALGERHSTTLAAAVNYAISRGAQERGVAESVQHKAHEALRALLGDEHPHTVAAVQGRRIDVGIDPLEK